MMMLSSIHVRTRVVRTYRILKQKLQKCSGVVRRSPAASSQYASTL